MYKFSFTQVFNDIRLTVYYSDGTVYHSTNDFYSINNFFSLVDMPQSKQLVMRHDGECDHETIVKWYQLDSEQGITA